MSTRRFLATVAIASVALAGCAESEPPAEPSTNATAPATSAQPTEPSTSPEPTPLPEVDLPATPVGEMAQFVVDALNAPEDVAPADLEPRLSDAILAEMPAVELADVVNTMVRPMGPFRATGFTPVGTQAALEVSNESDMRLNVSISVDEDGLLNGLYFLPVTDVEPASDFDDVQARLESMPVDVAAIVTVDGETVVELNPDDVAPLASVFKLYVLLAVADAVAAGDIGWDDPLPLDDAARSFPAGERDGVARTVREVATDMIAASDNTSTDMLMLLVGRESVEDAVRAAGHSDPALMSPILRTRELFQIAWGDGGSRLAQWAEADEAARRSTLDELAEEALQIDAADVTGDAVWDDGADWFATPRDILAVHRALAAHPDPVVREILAVNAGQGMEFDTAAWPYIAFKGGNSVGVLTGSWRAESADGEVLEVVVLSRGPDAASTATAQAEFFGLVESVFRLAAE